MIQLAKLIQSPEVKLGLGKEHQPWSIADILLLTPLLLKLNSTLSLEVIFS